MKIRCQRKCVIIEIVKILDIVWRLAVWPPVRSTKGKLALLVVQRLPTVWFQIWFYIRQHFQFSLPFTLLPQHDFIQRLSVQNNFKSVFLSKPSRCFMRRNWDLYETSTEILESFCQKFTRSCRIWNVKSVKMFCLGWKWRIQQFELRSWRQRDQ